MPAGDAGVAARAGADPADRAAVPRAAAPTPRPTSCRWGWRRRSRRRCPGCPSARRAVEPARRSASPASRSTSSAWRRRRTSTARSRARCCAPAATSAWARSSSRCRPAPCSGRTPPPCRRATCSASRTTWPAACSRRSRRRTRPQLPGRPGATSRAPPAPTSSTCARTRWAATTRSSRSRGTSTASAWRRTRTTRPPGRGSAARCASSASTWASPPRTSRRRRTRSRAPSRSPPSCGIAHKYSAHLEAESGRVGEALARLLARARVDRNDPEIFGALVHACRYAGLQQESLAAHAEALRLDPNASTSVAFTLWAQGDYAALADGRSDVIDQHPRALALVCLGRTGGGAGRDRVGGCAGVARDHARRARPDARPHRRPRRGRDPAVRRDAAALHRPRGAGAAGVRAGAGGEGGAGAGALGGVRGRRLLRRRLPARASRGSRPCATIPRSRG